MDKYLRTTRSGVRWTLGTLVQWPAAKPQRTEPPPHVHSPKMQRGKLDDREKRRKRRSVRMTRLIDVNY